MGNFTSGFQEMINKLNKAKQEVPTAIDNSILETGYDVIAVAKDRSPIDTGTLESSWTFNEDTKQIGSNTDNGTHSVEIFSDPQIIATNPKTPNGDYYPTRIENGYTMANGKKYIGHHMLKVAITPAKKNLKSNLQQELKEVFNEN